MLLPLTLREGVLVWYLPLTTPYQTVELKLKVPGIGMARDG